MLRMLDGWMRGFLWLLPPLLYLAVGWWVAASLVWLTQEALGDLEHVHLIPWATLWAALALPVMARDTGAKLARGLYAERPRETRGPPWGC